MLGRVFRHGFARFLSNFRSVLSGYAVANRPGESLGLGRALAVLAVALFVAGHALAQEEPLICPSSADRPVYAKQLRLEANWHTALAAGTSQPKLWQVGYLNALPSFDLSWQPVMRFPTPYSRLRGRELIGVDLVVQAQAVEGGDVPAHIWLLGRRGIGDSKKMTPAQLQQGVREGINLEDAYFYEGETREPYVFWVDPLVPYLQSAIDAREVYFSVFLAPTAAAGSPSHQARIKQAYLRIHHCPPEKPSRQVSGLARYLKYVQ